MVTASYRVVLDANVLFPLTLRDTLLRAAAGGYFQLYWSDEILDEARRNLVARGAIDDAQAERLFSTMRRAFPEAEVEGYEPLVDAMPNDPKDRHVAAAAARAGAQRIVTFNLRDFRPLPAGIEAVSPSDFLIELLELDPDGVVTLLRTQAAALRRPAKTLDELLDGLAKTVPAFVARTRQQLRRDDPESPPNEDI